MAPRCLPPRRLIWTMAVRCRFSHEPDSLNSNLCYILLTISCLEADHVYTMPSGSRSSLVFLCLHVSPKSSTIHITKGLPYGSARNRFVRSENCAPRTRIQNGRQLPRPHVHRQAISRRP